MSQITYKSEKVAKKKVFFLNNTGTNVILQGGYAVCYKYDATDISQAYTVVRPATLNLKYFAGVICDEYTGRVVANGASLQIEIYIPTKYGQIVLVWINEDHSGDTALLEPTDGSFVLTEGAANKVARTVQLVNRAAVNGTCLARLYGLSDPLA